MKWNLRSKLSASLAVAFGLLAFEAGVSQWAIWHVRSDIERLSEQTPITRYARDLVEAVSAESSAVGSYVQLHDRSFLDERDQSVQRQRLAMTGLDDAIQHAAYLAPLIAELKAQRISLRRTLDAEVAATDAQHATLATWLVLRTQDALASLRISSDSIGDAVASDVLAASSEYRTATQQAALLTILTVVGSTLLFSIIAMTFGGSVSRRLGEVSSRFGRFADRLGDRSLEIDDEELLATLRWTPLDEEGEDEIAQLARGSNRLVRRLITTSNALFEQQQRFKATLSSITDVVIRTRADGTVDYVNPAAVLLLGYDIDAKERPMLSDLFTLEIDDGISVDPVARCLERHGTVIIHDDTRLRLPSGRLIEVACSVAPLYSREGALRGTVIGLRDVTDQRSMARRLEHQAHHDALTGLFNRRRLENDVEEALLLARSEGRTHALLYIDVDQFKVVNDTCGHRAGDEFLCKIASLCTPLIGDNDTFARIGGDEFVVLLRDRSIGQAEQIADELREIVAKSIFMWHEKRFPMTISVGVVPITANSGDMATLLSAVDAACYAAKDAGRNRVQMYGERDSALVRTFGEMHWVARINRAIGENRLRLFYQPICSIGENQHDFRHVELLLRMVDEESKLIAPIEFLPAAERYNLMGAIDRWVISHALPICSRLIENGLLDLCAINLSDASLKHEGLSTYIQLHIAQSGIDPRALCFEITETVAVTNAGRVATLMQELRMLGCRFALDDFGSGMSSFGLLKHLPVDYLKIDGTFVKGMADDSVDYAMVEAINRVGHIMGIKTIAEYVSKREIAERLQEIGVDYGQGYALGRPEPLTDLLAKSRLQERRLRLVGDLRAS